MPVVRGGAYLPPRTIATSARERVNPTVRGVSCISATGRLLRRRPLRRRLLGGPRRGLLDRGLARGGRLLDGLLRGLGGGLGGGLLDGLRGGLGGGRPGRCRLLSRRRLLPGLGRRGLQRLGHATAGD